MRYFCAFKAILHGANPRPGFLRYSKYKHIKMFGSHGGSLILLTLELQKPNSGATTVLTGNNAEGANLLCQGSRRH